jgi:hypothetical protein
MVASNESVLMGYDDEVPNMGVYAKETPQENKEISDINEDEAQSAAEIASAFTIVSR